MIKWHAENNKIIIRDLRDFDPAQTFECGQCFRWRQLENHNWLGIVKGLVAEIEWNGRDLVFLGASPEEFTDVWFPYFDLETDYSEIKKKLTENDPVMERAIRLGSGIRLLRQDFNETLISFIVSQNNNIPRIRKIVECLAENFGRPIIHGNDECFSFPSTGEIAALPLEALACLRAGYRTGYILRASRQINDGLIDTNRIKNMKTSDARAEMLKLYGVGGKVADCVLLFSGLRRDAFPVDRWVARVMSALYPGSGVKNDEIAAFARERFGDNAGIAQQYLFYYAREMKIGVEKLISDPR